MAGRPAARRPPRDGHRDGVAAALPSDQLGSPSLLVASRNDPWLEFSRARDLAERWGSRLVDIGEAGHINTESGHGAWPQGMALLAALQDACEGFPLGAIDDAGKAPAAGRRFSALARLRRQTRANMGA